MKRFIMAWFPSLYWDGRLDGWLACENMVMARIKEKYPDKVDELFRELLQ